jgi:hypothetical protein
VVDEDRPLITGQSGLLGALSVSKLKPKTCLSLREAQLMRGSSVKILANTCEAAINRIQPFERF